MYSSYNTGRTKVNLDHNWGSIPNREDYKKLDLKANVSLSISSSEYEFKACIFQFRNFEDETEMSATTDFDIGGDAKIAVTSGLNLDLTLNPDFY